MNGITTKPQRQGGGRNVVKVLQRYLLTQTPNDEKLQYTLVQYRNLLPLLYEMIAVVKLWRYFCLPPVYLFSQKQKQ